jgi:hypothetical protein
VTNGTIVIGNGPIDFMDSGGEQVSVPLSALKIESGQVDLESSWADKAGLSGDDPSILKGLLAELQRQGYLRSAPAPTQKPAMIVKAASPGPEGNNIEITVSEVTQNTDAPLDPLKTTFSVTAKETDEYPDLMLASIATVLGIDEDPKGTGLVHVVTGSVAADGVPAEKIGTKALKLGPGAQVEVKDKDDKTLFTLKPRASLGSSDPKVKVTITEVDTAKKTFKLTATWKKKVTGVKVDPATLESKFQELEYLVTVSPPASGAYSVPKAEARSLSGGSAATRASLILFANQ